jgi:phage terminase Nu1 subunit (DNA packaging protein)
MSGAQTFPLDTICKLLDLTPQRVAQLVNNGVIPRKERGRYELVPVVRGYIHYLRERAIKGDAQAGGDDYATHRARLTKAKADMAEMEKDQMASVLIPASDVGDAWETMTGNMRARMLAIPSKAIATVFSAEDVNEAKKILQEAINEALAELSSIEVKTANPIRSTELDDDSTENNGASGSTSRTKD